MDAKREAAVQELHKFAIQEGIRALQHQEAELGRMRDRAIALAGLTAAAAAFLVGAGLKAPHGGWSFYAPLGLGSLLYLGLLYQSWLLLKPVPKWKAKVSGTVILEDFASQEPAAAYASLAGFYEQARLDNEASLTPLRSALVLALAFAGGTVVSFLMLAWLVA